jgi:hypothetical protein
MASYVLVLSQGSAINDCQARKALGQTMFVCACSDPRCLVVCLCCACPSVSNRPPPTRSGSRALLMQLGNAMSAGMLRLFTC